MTTIYIRRDGVLIPMTRAEKAALDRISERAKQLDVPRRLDMWPLVPSDYTPSEGGAQEVCW